LFADETAVYGILPSGDLQWFPHWKTPDSAPRPTDGKVIGWGWSEFIHVFAGGGGTIYAISSDGALRWYKHSFGTGPGIKAGASLWAEGSGNIIGSGWAAFLECVLGR
jgi:hypothetical protein